MRAASTACTVGGRACCPGLGRDRDELLQEQRVALGGPDDRVDEHAGRPTGDQCPRVRVGERLEGEQLCSRGAAPPTAAAPRAGPGGPARGAAAASRSSTTRRTRRGPAPPARPSGRPPGPRRAVGGGRPPRTGASRGQAASSAGTGSGHGPTAATTRSATSCAWSSPARTVARRSPSSGRPSSRSAISTSAPPTPSRWPAVSGPRRGPRRRRARRAAHSPNAICRCPAVRAASRAGTSAPRMPRRTRRAAPPARARGRRTASAGTRARRRPPSDAMRSARPATPAARPRAPGAGFRPRRRPTRVHRCRAAPRHRRRPPLAARRRRTPARRRSARVPARARQTRRPPRRRRPRRPARRARGAAPRPRRAARAPRAARVARRPRGPPPARTPRRGKRRRGVQRYPRAARAPARAAPRSRPPTHERARRPAARPAPCNGPRPRSRAAVRAVRRRAGAPPRAARRARVLGQHRLLQASQGGSGLQPEVGGQAAVHAAVGLQRVRLAAGRVQRVHEQLGQPLAVRMLVQQALQLPDRRRVTSEGKVGLHARLDRSKAQFLQPVRLAARERGNAELSQRNAAPQRECLAQPARGGLRIAGLQRRTAVGGERLEAPRGRERHRRGAARSRPGASAAPAPAAATPAAATRSPAASCAPSPGRAHPRARRSAGRATDLAGMEQEDRQQRARLGPFQRQRPIAADRLERSQYPELHRCGDHLSRAFHRQGTAAIPACNRAGAGSSASTGHRPVPPDTEGADRGDRQDRTQPRRARRGLADPGPGGTSSVRRPTGSTRFASTSAMSTRAATSSPAPRRRRARENNWIPRRVPGVGAAARATPEIEPPEPPTNPARQARPMPFELTAPDAQVGPPGTVPVLRKPVEQIHPVGDLQAPLQGPPAQGAHARGRPGPRRSSARWSPGTSTP